MIELIIKLAVEVSYQFLILTMTFLHWYKAKILDKKYFSTDNIQVFLIENLKQIKQLYLALITRSFLHLLFFKSCDQKGRN